MNYAYQRLGLTALLLISLAGAVRAQSTGLVVPPDLQLSIMIKTTLIAYNHANLTGNYSVLRDLGSPGFQKANTPARLAEIFGEERNRNVDLSAVVVLAPKLLHPATIDAQGRLVLVGLFDSKPDQVNFTIAFEAVEGIWRLYALGVKTGPQQAGNSAFNEAPSSEVIRKPPPSRE